MQGGALIALSHIVAFAIHVKPCAAIEATQMAMSSDVLKALIFDADGKTPPGIGDTIVHEGTFWLALGWYETPDHKARKPKRIIPLEQFGLQRLPPGQQTDLLVNHGIPKELYAAVIPQELRSKFGVLDDPEIQLPLAQ